jgi:hypothetical protein
MGRFLFVLFDPVILSAGGDESFYRREDTRAGRLQPRFFRIECADIAEHQRACMAH